MTLDAAPQVQFATEFALFLVALAGLAFVVLGAELLTRTAAVRAALAVGFATLGTTAFLHGSLLVDDPTTPGLVLGRAAGWLAVAAGAARWRGGALARNAAIASVVTGLLSVAASGASVGGDGVAAGLQALAALALGGALLSASKRAIAARVAASAAATLLLVVLVLSVGLSAVLSNNVEDQALTALDGRAEREANAVESATRELISQAGIGVSGLTDDERRVASLTAIADGRGTADQRAAVQRFLEGLSGVFQSRAFAYADASAGVVAEVGLGPGDALKLTGSEAVQEVLSAHSARGAVVVVGDEAFVVGVAPVVVTLDGGRRGAAAVIATRALDGSYLDARAASDERVALTLRSRLGVVGASSDEQPANRVATRLAARVLDRGGQAVAIEDGRFLAAQAVRNVDRPVLALIASRPTTAVDEIRENLFRTFFVIAFGGALLALLLSALVGDRISAGVRRLTASAQALQAGEAGVRSGVRSEDEVGVLGATFDTMAASIEDKTEALREAAADEARLRSRVEAIVAGMGEALVAVDEANVVTDFNAAAEDLFGLPAAAAKGRPIAEVVDASTEDGEPVARRLVVDGASRWSALGEAVVGDEHVPVAMTVGTLRGPQQEVTGRVLVVRDLRAEQEVERMKREFLSRVGHELRTPLTPLLGYARILAGRELPPDRARDISQSMVEAGERLGRVVEMLEFFATAQAGRTVVRPEVVDVRALVSSAVQERAATANGHLLTKRVRAGTPNVQGDPYWLRRSVDELIDNAIKFSPGGGKIVVTAEATADGSVEIAVRDTGVGMSPEEVDRAFAEFVQGDESDTRAYGGLGLGLALVRRVVEHHGGRVRCETAPGKGSKFSLVLPAMPTEEGDASRRRPRAVRARDGGIGGNGRGGDEPDAGGGGG